jgi:hypothetical protein
MLEGGLDCCIMKGFRRKFIPSICFAIKGLFTFELKSYAVNCDATDEKKFKLSG